jgi:hypothetical protein
VRGEGVAEHVAAEGHRLPRSLGDEVERPGASLPVSALAM